MSEELSRLHWELAALKTENERWRKVFDFVRNLIIITDPAGAITLLNQKACEVLGYRKSECIGKNWFDLFFTNETKNSVIFHARKLISGDIEEIRYLETPMYTKYRSPKIIAWRSMALNDEAGKPAGIFNTGEDITDKKHLEREVLQSEARYKAMLEVLPDAIHVMDREYRITYWNPSFQKFARQFGLAEEAVGKNIFEVFPFLEPEVKAEYQRVFHTGEVLITQEENILGGRIVATETRKIPLVKDGLVEAIVTLVREIPFIEK